MSTVNPWEAGALSYQFPDDEDAQKQRVTAWSVQTPKTLDPIIYPGLYCPSGFDMMNILLLPYPFPCRVLLVCWDRDNPSVSSTEEAQFIDLNKQIRVASRPMPQVHLGAVDASCALILCDLAQPDTPIVYSSEAFSMLTGYQPSEYLGRNCRFLQAPGGNVQPCSKREYVDPQLVNKMCYAVRANKELQVEVTNFRKDGTAFINLLTMIPVRWDSQDFRYSVGFQCEKEVT